MDKEMSLHIASPHVCSRDSPLSGQAGGKVGCASVVCCSPAQQWPSERSRQATDLHWFLLGIKQTHATYGIAHYMFFTFAHKLALFQAKKLTFSKSLTPLW